MATCDRAILSSTLFLAVFAPLAYGSVEPWALYVIQGTVLLMACLWIGKWFSSGKPRPRTAPFGAAALLFLFLTALQLTPLPASWRAWLSPPATPPVDSTTLIDPSQWSPLSLDPKQTAQSAISLLTYLVFGFVVLNTLGNKRQLGAIVTLLIFLGAFEALYGLVEYLSGNQSIFWYQRLYYLGDVTGTYINHNHFAGLMALVLPLAISLFPIRYAHYLSARSSNRQRLNLWPTSLVLLALAILSMLLALVLSQSRGGLLASTLSLGLLAFLLVKLKRRAAVPVIPSGGLLLAVASGIILVAFGHELTTRFSYSLRDAPQRFDLWLDTAKIVRDHPVLGIGLGTFAQVLPRYRPQKDFYFVQNIPQPAKVRYAHNDYLQLLAECGFIGFGLVVWGLWATREHLVGQSSDALDAEVNILRYGFLSGLVAMLLHSVVDFNFHIPANALLFCLFSSCLLFLTSDGRSAAGQEK